MGPGSQSTVGIQENSWRNFSKISVKKWTFEISVTFSVTFYKKIQKSVTKRGVLKSQRHFSVGSILGVHYRRANSKSIVRNLRIKHFSGFIRHLQLVRPNSHKLSQTKTDFKPLWGIQEIIIVPSLGCLEYSFKNAIFKLYKLYLFQNRWRLRLMPF